MMTIMQRKCNGAAMMQKWKGGYGCRCWCDWWVENAMAEERDNNGEHQETSNNDEGDNLFWRGSPHPQKQF